MNHDAEEIVVVLFNNTRFGKREIYCVWREYSGLFCWLFTKLDVQTMLSVLMIKRMAILPNACISSIAVHCSASVATLFYFLPLHCLTYLTFSSKQSRFWMWDCSVYKAVKKSWLRIENRLKSMAAVSVSVVEAPCLQSKRKADCLEAQTLITFFLERRSWGRSWVNGSCVIVWPRQGETHLKRMVIMIVSCGLLIGGNKHPILSAMSWGSELKGFDRVHGLAMK